MRVILTAVVGYDRRFAARIPVLFPVTREFESGDRFD
jgi:hypothetical protein